MPIAIKYEPRKLLLLDGSCPFDDWFGRLEVEDQYMVDNRLIRVRLGSFGGERTQKKDIKKAKALFTSFRTGELKDARR